MAGANQQDLPAIFISNFVPEDGRTFSEKQEKAIMKGGEIHLKQMKAVFCDLGFQPLNLSGGSRHTNLFAKDLYHADTVPKTSCDCLKCLISKTVVSETKCFLFCISTHGGQINGEHFVAFLDESEGCYKVDINKKIIEMLNCKKLSGKQRILIIDSCRDDAEVPGIYFVSI